MFDFTDNNNFKNKKLKDYKDWYKIEIKDKDINATMNILQEWIKNRVPLEQRKFKSVEIKTTDLIGLLSIN